jgi:hypothetical protein
MPVVVVVETTILRFGIRFSSAAMSWVAMLTSPTLTAWIQRTCRLVMACFTLAVNFPKRSENPSCQFPRRRMRTK